MATAEKIQEAIKTKSEIKQAIINAGGNIKDDTIFSDYPKYIDDIYVGVISISTSEEMDSVLLDTNIGKIYRYIGETNNKYTKGQCYIVEGVE